MAGIGTFMQPARTVVKMPINPMDKCTLISVYPKAIHEVKATLSPGVFNIEAAPPDDISVLVVTSSSWFKEMEEGQPYLEIPNSSIQIAESVCKDWMNGMMGCDMDQALPGLFYVPGAYTKEEAKKKFVVEIAEARVKQKKYFKNRVDLADVMFARTNGNPLAIDDEARLGAELLGLKDKQWLQDFKSVDMVACRACGQFINPNFPICQFCHVINNEAKAKELGLKFASQ